MKCLCFLTSLTLLINSLAFSNDAPPLSFTPSHEPTLIVNNRILTKINNKPISVLDVMKKMDVFINRFYPEYSENIPAKHHYFSHHWKETLLQMIDHELIMLDAEKLQLKITDAEIRESILERFGPNIMTSLDRLQLTYDEAKEMVENELIVERMTWYRINSKALQNVNPQEIKCAYKDYLEKNPAQENWDYQVLSIRAKDLLLGQQIANQAHELLSSSKESLSAIADRIQSEHKNSPYVTITLSDDLQNNTKTASEAHKKVLLTMVKDSISAPVKQMSKSDQGTVFRIFHLKDHKKILPLPFSQISEKLKNDLLNLAVQKESAAYLEKLRIKFGYDVKTLTAEIPVDFQPFDLK